MCFSPNVASVASTLGLKNRRIRNKEEQEVISDILNKVSLQLLQRAYILGGKGHPKI